MNIIDYIIIVAVLIFCIKGYLKGFINELFSLLIIILGLTVSFLFYKSLSSVVYTFIENKDLAFIVSFLSIFILVTILLIIIRNTLTNLIDSLNFTGADYILGLFIGLIKGIILCSALLIFLKNHPVLKIDAAIKSSCIYPFLEKIFITFLSFLPENQKIIIYRVLDIK